MDAVKRISKAFRELTGCRLNYRDTVIAFADGREARFSELSEITLGKADSGMWAEGKLGAYTLRLTVDRTAPNQYRCGVVLTPDTSVTDPVRRVDGFVFDALRTPQTHVLHKDFLNEGIHKLEELQEEFISEHWFSLWEADAPDEAVNMMSGLNAKFYSQVGAQQAGGGVSIRLSTVIPYSYQGIIRAEPWELYVDTEPFAAVERQAKLFAQEQTVEAPVGWSTWDYYFTSATEEDVREQVDFIAEDPVLKDKVRYIAIDDGWQQREGDWYCGCRYPSGLEALTRYIESKGFRAGVWVAPTRLHFLCGTVMRRNAFLSRDAYGDPIKDEDMYMLDPTHPDGERFLRETFGYLSRCGFTFFKLDFISNVFKMERFYDPSAGPYDALKKLVEIVRQTVPEGSHIMGCSLPYGMGAGFVDSRRTGLDIHNTYKHLIQCTEGYLPQFASNERIYRNDLDYLIVRGPDTSEDPMTNPINPSAGRYKAEPTDRFRWRDGKDFQYNEAKMWCGILLMSGSSLFMGDKLTGLNDRGLDLIRRTVCNADFHAAVPQMQRSSGLPEVWRKENALYLFNFGEDAKVFTVKADGQYRDVFTDVDWCIRGQLEVTLAGHDCLCLHRVQ